MPAVRTSSPHPGPMKGGLPAELGVGAIGGMIGGLFGGGSGVFYVPALESLTGLPRPTLHGTATAANTAVVGVGALTFALVGGHLDWHAGLGVLIGGTIGGLFGAALLLKVSPAVLRRLFVAVLLASVVKLVLDIAGTDPLEGGAVFPAGVVSSWAYIAPVSLVCGSLIGAWAAAVGLGGGLLAVPVLMVLFGCELHTAIGTSLLMFFPNSIVGWIMHARQRTASPRLSLTLNLGALPGAVLGAVLALVLNATALSVVYAAFCLFVAVRELVRMGRARVRDVSGSAGPVEIPAGGAAE
ncbi:sulfite exporter TauE/SafE family protein [Actinacidiphila sp. DG2A-62]|uniref:sulfite exporter TauE/SafE family protein n=1 Tax=Actinacidiphila sp. DG2A-62 TaxID=3108821 RepID=UPI002DBF60F6|nr:sulfite exporter TauE/SafE family protein [Actinacidiphila sp. DG2A-62]MEC3997263.1 sulfite exporter TauE/SafE family protein [Actinacidiphila sp. DG2A-62]